MREYRFRGKIAPGIVSAGCWVYWGLNTTDMLDSIDHDTIGQFVGQRDSSGEKIYADDLFRCIYHSDGHTDHIYQVVYSEECAGFVLKRIGRPCPQSQVFQRVSDVARYERIGNVHDNPELLEATK